MSAAQITETLQRFDASQGPRKVGPTDGLVAQLGGCDARFLVFGEESGGGFSLVEHPVPPRSLCAPRHRHHGVDEYSFVLDLADRHRVLALDLRGFGWSDAPPRGYEKENLAADVPLPRGGISVPAPRCSTPSRRCNSARPRAAWAPYSATR